MISCIFERRDYIVGTNYKLFFTFKSSCPWTHKNTVNDCFLTIYQIESLVNDKIIVAQVMVTVFDRL